MDQQPSNTFKYPAEPEPFIPADLGLNPDKEEDLQLYIDSGADRVTADLLLGMREATKRHSNGELGDQDFDLSVSAVYSAIEQRRYALGFPPRKVI